MDPSYQFCALNSKTHKQMQDKHKLWIYPNKQN